ncbi:EAL domain-containing protein [Oceanobacillus sp. Castelsardo]|uniref:EAL domain-containing protein n=1 Tax=Oceanobacillus sp. Castelsardo TaxID=1851204 RepID=UPI0009EF1060|nr:EAL domain-containing protein [Oceanobacillus sp. Castelsardo]
MLHKEMSLLLEEEQFHHHFQPLYNLNEKNRIGFEVLFRTNLYNNPELVFQSARTANKLYELETKSIGNAISTYSKSGKVKQNLFINVFPTTISNPLFSSFMNKIVNKNNIKSEEIIFEINESEIIFDMPLFLHGLENLKRKGFLFAIDDVGKGAASLRAIIELEPDYVKMDKYFAFNLSTSEQKQEMVKSVLTYCENTHTEFVLEGIENETDLKTAQKIGVPNGQGFLLGKPAPL